MASVAGKMGRMSVPDIHEQRPEILRKQAVERLRGRRAYRCPECGYRSFQRDCSRCGRDRDSGSDLAREATQRPEAAPVAMLAFEFLVLTAARWGEVRWAEWSEIDQTQGMWTVPETRMKSKREHRMPLCHRAKEILDEVRTLDDGAARLVFTRGGGKPLADRQLRHLLHRNKIAAVPHGFRSSSRQAS